MKVVGLCSGVGRRIKCYFGFHDFIESQVMDAYFEVLGDYTQTMKRTCINCGTHRDKVIKKNG